MTIEVSIHHLAEATEVCLRGVAEQGVLARVGEALLATVPSGQQLILNLEELELIDGAGFDGLVGPLLDSRDRAGAVGIVCPPLAAGRSQLKTCCRKRDLIVHPNVSAALAHPGDAVVASASVSIDS